MKPLSAPFFLLRNKTRAIILTLMMALVFICELGGMYVDNPGILFYRSMEANKEFLWIAPDTINYGSDEYLELDAYIRENAPENASTVFHVGYSYVAYKNIMQSRNTQEGFLFCSVEDFLEFNDKVDYLPDDVVIGDHEIVMTKLLADNNGLSVGDIISVDDPDSPLVVANDMRLAATFDDNSYMFYGIDSVEPGTSFLVLSSVSPDSPEHAAVQESLESFASQLRNEYGNKIYVYSYDSTFEQVATALEFMYFVFWGMIIIIAFVLSLTINATISGIYEKRTFEYAIYRALGFGNLTLLRKTAGEILIMNVLGLIVGAILTWITVITLNEVLLLPNGMVFPAISSKGILATFIADLVVVIPAIFLNWLKIRKLDVTEY